MKNIENVDVNRKKVIVRVDFNVPIKNKRIEDDNRIRMSLKTINYLIDNNAKIILLSHLGKIKEESDKGENTLEIVYERLSKLVNTKVYFSKNTRGKELEKIINDLNFGEIVLVENTRYEDLIDSKESLCDETLSKYWASLGDIFVLDAFASCHRNHASTYGIGKYLPTYAGFLLEKEISVLEKIINEKNKTIILGGSKVEDKLGTLKNLINECNNVFLGGAMAFTFLKMLGYNVEPNFIDTQKFDEIKNLYESNKDKILLPIDFITENGIKDIEELSNEYAYDIGPKTIELYKNSLNKDDLVVWNGPLGKFENAKYENGTKEILEYLYKNKIKTFIAGGDTGNAVHRYNLDFYYISTGGGATMEYLSGTKFKSLENIEK